MDTELWPPAGLRVRSGDIELRYPDDEDLAALARLAGEGVHAADFMPFTAPWSRGTPEEVARGVLRYQWTQRAALNPSSWRLELAVVRRGPGGEELLGMQSAGADNFPVTRTAETGSWLGLRHQGRGVGTAARAMILHLLFEGLGAREATTGAFEDNGPSNGVTRKLGYEPNGATILDREGVAVRELRYRMTREAWAGADRPHVELVGVGPVREFLGLG